MEKLPVYISVVFAATTLVTVFAFYMAANRSRLSLLVILIWLTIQGIISLNGFYTVTNTTPPRFLLLVLPPLMMILILFCTNKGRKYIDGLNPGILTLLHTVRVVVEMVLYWLFIHSAVPGLMTFTGRNFDIISGLTAPLIVYFGFIKKRLNKTFLLVWNFTCLLLLINIVVNAILSAPFPFQQFAFSQPNIAILYFPFLWLPCCIVPIVLFSHLATIRQILKPSD